MASSNEDSSTERNYYHYIPSLVSAVIACIIFLLLSLAHLWRMVKNKTWFMTALIVGGFFEFIGFAARGYGHDNYTEKTPFIVQTVLILVAPSLFAATIYMILSRVIRAIRAEKYSMVRVTWLTKIFVVGDVLCFFVQAAGGSILAGSTDHADLGKNVVLLGLILQILLFGFFIVTTVVFHTRLRKAPSQAACRAEIPWEKMLTVLYAASGLIMFRNIYRVIEYGIGVDGYLYTHEWAAYAFDAALMAAVMAILLFFYPTLTRPKDSFQLENVEAQPINGENSRFKRQSFTHQNNNDRGYQQANTRYQGGLYQNGGYPGGGYQYQNSDYQNGRYQNGASYGP
ncbi:uncharacterized protein Z518_03214 [Rhinocladiella mackenziei CBS 650.93]|uniref:RTA1 domain protein n=1 Tax=Rhinocladiella mackenziei CBS 650.93 TaxID=1442369 RepID=A0A0D2HDH2_9EURO|nr:uncharacterized protein Z518_03214 [Rhinocladiella mackenziei CBS 650.93]KIX08558.1 hypothetical protein Z518_03214 [Rhinocladiella mackenziei CBS 650.93]